MSSPVKNDPLGGSLPPMASKGKQFTSEPAEAKGNRVDYRLEQRRLGFFMIFHDFSWRLLRLFFKGDSDVCRCCLAILKAA